MKLVRCASCRKQLEVPESAPEGTLCRDCLREAAVTETTQARLTGHEPARELEAEPALPPRPENQISFFAKVLADEAALSGVTIVIGVSDGERAKMFKSGAKARQLAEQLSKWAGGS